MKYQFKLEAVRRLREFEEEKCQREFGDALRIMEGEQQILHGLFASRKRTEEAFRDQTEQGDTSGQAMMYHHYLQKLAGDIEVQNEKVSKAKKVCEQMRQALLTAMKKRKALDRLKEKGEQAFLEQLNSEEQKFINEIAINRFMLNQK